MSSPKPNSVPSPQSVHDVWLRQRAELERELFDGWTVDVHEAAPPAIPVSNPSEPTSGNLRMSEAPTEQKRTTSRESVGHSAKLIVPAPLSGNLALSSQAITSGSESPPAPLDAEKAQHAQWLMRANETALRQRVEHQRHVEECLTQQREAFYQDLAQQRMAFEQELSTRQAVWTAQRDQEWAALRSAQEVQDATAQRLKEELAEQRVREREEMLEWRKQAESELAEARRVFEQERLQQQQEFARQREAEMETLRRERDAFDTRVRQVQAELAVARQRQEGELRHTQEGHSAQMRAERLELDKLRDTWLEKFRREQVVLENGLQFFEQHLSRVSEELRVAQRGLQAVTESATEARPTLPSVRSLAAKNKPDAAIEAETEPTILSLEEISQRLNWLKSRERRAA